MVEHVKYEGMFVLSPNVVSSELIEWLEWYEFPYIFEVSKLLCVDMGSQEVLRVLQGVKGY